MLQIGTGLGGDTLIATNTTGDISTGSVPTFSAGGSGARYTCGKASWNESCGIGD